MGSLSIWHWAIVLIIVMMVFGTKKLRNVGSDLGGAIKGFKDGMRAGAVPETPTFTPAPTIGTVPQESERKDSPKI